MRKISQTDLLKQLELNHNIKNELLNLTENIK